MIRLSRTHIPIQSDISHKVSWKYLPCNPYARNPAITERESERSHRVNDRTPAGRFEIAGFEKKRLFSAKPRLYHGKARAIVGGLGNGASLPFKHFPQLNLHLSSQPCLSIHGAV